MDPHEITEELEHPGVARLLAEGEGFEPPMDRRPTTVFETFLNDPQPASRAEHRGRGTSEGTKSERHFFLATPSAAAWLPQVKPSGCV
jgi:hypothetical protein